MAGAVPPGDPAGRVQARPSWRIAAAAALLVTTCLGGAWLWWPAAPTPPQPAGTAQTAGSPADAAGEPRGTLALAPPPDRVDAPSGAPPQTDTQRTATPPGPEGAQPAAAAPGTASAPLAAAPGAAPPATPEREQPPAVLASDATPHGSAAADARDAAPPLASESELAAMLPAAPAMFRLRENPQVFVLLFPSLDQQGAALNRVAALAEKSGLPRDRVVNDQELARAIQRHGDTPATWYLGHDYPGSELGRFLSLAERDGIVLNDAERWVRDRFLEARALVPAEQEIALISTAGPDSRMDTAMRAAILRHEIGHGHFFTLPEVRARVLKAWRERFRESERQAFRGFLGREGYDTGNETLMANETMAYLVFTPDPRFFAPRHVGMTEAEVARLRDVMREAATP